MAAAMWPSLLDIGTKAAHKMLMKSTTDGQNCEDIDECKDSKICPAPGNWYKAFGPSLIYNTMCKFKVTIVYFADIFVCHSLSSWQKNMNMINILKYLVKTIWNWMIQSLLIYY